MEAALAAMAALSTPGALAALVFGTALGVVIGALPGLGSVVGLSICLPFTFGMETVPGLTLLLGVYCGSVFGGSISAILINSPGTPQAAATTLDGYPMAQRGEAGLALGWAMVSSVIGGLVSCAALIFATRFGSVEISAIIVLALALVGTDPVTGAARFTFGTQHLAAGFDLISVVIGLFALSEAFFRVAIGNTETAEVSNARIRVPALADWRGGS